MTNVRPPRPLLPSSLLVPPPSTHILLYPLPSSLLIELSLTQHNLQWQGFPIPQELPPHTHPNLSSLSLSLPLALSFSCCLFLSLSICLSLHRGRDFVPLVGGTAAAATWRAARGGAGGAHGRAGCPEGRAARQRGSWPSAETLTPYFRGQEELLTVLYL